MADRSCGVIPVFYDGQRWRYLLVEERSHNWGFPKGRIESGEEPLDTARRELSEEVGIERVEILSAPVFYNRFTMRSGGRNVKRQMQYFLGRVESTKIVRQQSDILDAHWFDYQSAKLILAPLGTLNVLTSAHHFLLRHSWSTNKKTR